MKTLTVDDDQRVRLPDARPRQKFSYKKVSAGRIILALVEEADVPLAKARKVNGRWMGAEGVGLDREAVINSIREDRER